MRKILLLLLVSPTLNLISYSKNNEIEITVSNNALLNEENAGLIELIPDEGGVPSDCILPKIIFDSPNKLTKKIKIPQNCIPSEANQIEVLIKRNPRRLENVQEKINSDSILSGFNITTDPDVIVADRKTFYFQNKKDEVQNDVFSIGDPDEKALSINGKAISVFELKNLLFTLGLLTSYELNEKGYTEEVNQAYWKFVCLVEEARQLVLSQELRFQTTEEPLKCTVTHIEGIPDKKYLEDAILWKEVISGLKTRVGEDLSNFINPATLGILASFIALNSILPVNSWIIFVATLGGNTFDIATRINEVKDLWNNSSNTNSNQTNFWKIGYSIGTLLTAIPNFLPFNPEKSKKVLEEAAKLDNYPDLQKLIIKEQKLIYEIKEISIQDKKQNLLNSFVEVLEKVSNSGKRIFNRVINDFQTRGFDTGDLIKKISVLSNDAKSSLVRILNRESFIVYVDELSSQKIVFVLSQLEQNEFENKVILVAKNLTNGRQNYQATTGIKVLKKESLKEILNGERTIANEKGVTFITFQGEYENFKGTDLLKRLGLNTPQDIKRFQNKEIIVLRFDVEPEKILLPSIEDFGANESFIPGGITSGGAIEGKITGEPLSKKISTLEELNLNANEQNLGILKLTEIDIRKLLNENVVRYDELIIEDTIKSLKQEGRL